jgi:AraC-like DNA-binding protein
MSTRMKKKIETRAFEDIKWLNEVREVKYPLDESHPIFVREVEILSGDPQPRPSVKHPERHPFCEFNINFEGLITQFIGAEKAEREKGDFMLLGPDTPHYAFLHSYPHHTLTIYFLPLVLFAMGPNGDGAAMLYRFTAPQTIRQRLVSPSLAVRRRVTENMRAMAEEWKARSIGSELKLWGLLVNSLVELLRWELANGREITNQTPAQDWVHVEKALRYIHSQYAEALYIERIAEEVGMTPNRLRGVFRQALGTTCAHYISTLRIARAKALLCEPDAQITRVAHEVGFETLSHFNNSFLKQVGVSPTAYMRKPAVERSGRKGV